MALAMNKILVANTVTNTTSAYLQTTTVAAVTTGNGTVIVAGAYMMNPPGSSHAPFSESGCTLFVKLRHLGPDQIKREVVDTKTANWFQGMVPGLTVMPLMQQGSGSALVRWAPQTYFNPHRHYGGEEIFVVDGVFEDEHGRYPEGSWIRSPHMSLHKPFSKEGCVIFVKTGHLHVP